jgi:nucleoside diphosphate kinase
LSVIAATSRATVSDSVIDTVQKLRAMGATKVRVSADGTVEADFGPELSDDSDHQNEDPAPRRRLSATGGLVPRADGNS